MNTSTDNSISPTEQVHSVLIIDDSDEDRYLLKRFLKKTGLNLVVLEVANGQDGINLLTSPLDDVKKNHPQVAPPIILFLDINMPMMNGWEFVQELESRLDEVALNPAVVFMYSTGDAEYENNKIDDFSCVAGYIVKGDSSPESLKQAILEASTRH